MNALDSIKVVRVLCFSMVMLGLVSCSEEDMFSAELPEGVPSTSQLIGGMDGWVWIDCKSVSSVHLECNVFDQRGDLFRTSFLMPCLNIQPKNERDNLVPSKLDETLLYFDKVVFYEYKQSVYSNSDPRNLKIAEKYYNLLGVDNSCNPANEKTELIEKGVPLSRPLSE